jgi:hypothetical protein
MILRLVQTHGRSLILAIAPLLLISLISVFTGSWMGVRAVPPRQPVDIRAEWDGETIALTLHNPSQYRLRAEYGFILRTPDGAPLFRSDPQPGGLLAINERRTFAFALPPGVPRDGWVLEAWAREVVPLLDDASPRPETLVEPGAVARRAPMSIIGVLVEPGDPPAIAVDLRLTGATAQPILIRYALSLTRVQVQDNGAFAPLERAVMGRFTELTLLPDAARTFTERIPMPARAGDYAVTLWVQRATSEPGAFEHFAQFTSPQVITLP